MIGALIYVKQDLGIISSQPMPGSELDLALLAGLVAVIVLGPGRLSLDHQVGIEPRESSESREPATPDPAVSGPPVAHAWPCATGGTGAATADV